MERNVHRQIFVMEHFDPLDPSDDIVENQIIFWANASAGSPDSTYTLLEIKHV